MVKSIRPPILAPRPIFVPLGTSFWDSTDESSREESDEVSEGELGIRAVAVAVDRLG